MFESHKWGCYPGDHDDGGARTIAQTNGGKAMSHNTSVAKGMHWPLEKQTRTRSQSFLQAIDNVRRLGQIDQELDRFENDGRQEVGLVV